MKNTNKILNAAIVAVSVLFTATNISAMFSFPSGQPAQQQSQFKAPQQVQFKTPQQTQQQPLMFTFRNKTPQQTQQQPRMLFTSPSNKPQQPQENLDWNTEKALNLKHLTQASQESTETIKILSDKVAALEDTVKTMQATIDTLKDTVSQNYSTSIKMLNEALKK